MLRSLSPIYFLFTLLLSPIAQSAILINEFMAGNDSVLADPQGDYDDWIELYNSSSETVDLGGMYLTDDLEDKTAWQFPAGTQIAGNSYLLVWADKDPEDNPNGLHATFKLSKSGEDIALFASDGETLIDSISFGAQSDDISYGRYPDGSNSWYVFDSNPSPLSANVAASTPEVSFSVSGGPFSQAFTLFLSAAPNANIVYTKDGSIPSALLGPGGSVSAQTGTTFVYNPSIGIPVNRSESIIIRAQSIEFGKVPSRVKTEAYLAVSDSLAMFSSNIPVVIIETFNNQIPPKTWVNGTWVNQDPIASYASFYNTDNPTGRAIIHNSPEHSGRIGINVRGQSSSELPKQPYKVETWDENDQDIDVPLLGFPAESDWVFSNPYTDRTFMRTALAFELSNRMGHYSPRTKFVEVFVNEDGGQIGGPNSSDYQGVYVLMESIKRGDDRVDIEKFETSDSSGSYIIKHDKNRLEDEFSTWAGRWFYVEPSDTELNQAQKQYIKSDIEEFEQALQGNNFDDPLLGYRDYIDVASFIDNDFVSEITKEVDTYIYSTFVTKNRDGKLEMSPQWDFNLSMGNNDYNSFGIVDQHYASGWSRDPSKTGMWEYRWHARLMEDPEYLLEYADRWFHHRETVLSDESINASLDEKLALLAESAERNFNRWNILNYYGGFNWAWGHTFYFGGNPNIPGSTGDHTYEMQVEWLKNWLTGDGIASGSAKEIFYSSIFSDRFGWIDSNIYSRTGFYEPPTFKVNNLEANVGALVNDGDQLTITSDIAGSIYYTLDGTDPRESFTGNAQGSIFSTVSDAQFEEVLINTNSQIKYNIPSSTIAGWESAEYNDSSWNNGTNGLGYEVSGSDYVNLINTSVAEMHNNSSTVYIRIPFELTDKETISSMNLKMKYDDAFVAYINGVEVAKSFYAPSNLSWNSEATGYNIDANAIVYENFPVDLSNNLNLVNGSNILAIHALNHGSGSSDLLSIAELVLTKELSPDNLSNDIALNKTLLVKSRLKSETSWSALNVAIFADNKVKDSLRITEVMYHPEDQGQEYIELKNIGTLPISLYLCEFTDGIDFIFPDVILQPSEYILVVEDQAAFESKYGNEFNIAGEFLNGTGLSNGGEEIVLRDAAQREIHDFDYYDTIEATDGNGYSLTIINENDSNLENWDMDDFDGWVASSMPGGSPGEDNSFDPLSIKIEQKSDGLYIEWTGEGSIKSSDSMNGTWNIEEGISSPHLIDLNSETKKFFKID